MTRKQIKRTLEILPGVVSWTIILSLVGLLLFKPIIAAIIVIVYLIFWTTRLLYMSTLLVMAHHRMLSKRSFDWLKMCDELEHGGKAKDIVHLVLYTVYKEPFEVIDSSVNALKDVDYDKNKIIVVLAGEERARDTHEKLYAIKERYGEYFKEMLIIVHPKDIPGEIPCKGANATYAAKQAKQYLEENNIKLEDVVLSCFDADTCPDRAYFSCLTYNFIRQENRLQMSFQPLPIYSNNIYTVSACARVIEMGSTFWQLIESMRYEKFVTFSSHSMSFKTLVDVGYWPVNLVSDDSLIYWKGFLHFNGEYSTYSLEVPVYMDIAVGKNFWDTIFVQYKQKRRWAWGVETFVYLGINLLDKDKIPLKVKLTRMSQILDNHVNWATWAIIISFITPGLLLWGKLVEQNSLIFFNLSYINNVIFNSLTVILILCIFISKEFLPPKPKEVSRWIYVVFVLQWFMVPLVSAFLGSIPSLDAQTRMMFSSTLGFYPTPKKRDHPATIIRK
jgi:hypothetical protein